MKLRLLLAALLLTGLAACGGGDDDQASAESSGADSAAPSGSDDDASGGSDSDGGKSGENDDVLAKLDQMASEDDDNPFSIMTQDERSCVAGGLVEREDLVGAMLDDEDLEDLTTEQQGAFLDLLLGCAQDTFATFLAEEMAEDSGMTTEQATCFADGLMSEDGLINDLMQMGLSDSEPSAEVMAPLFQLMVDCEVPLG